MIEIAFDTVEEADNFIADTYENFKGLWGIKENSNVRFCPLQLSRKNVTERNLLDFCDNWKGNYAQKNKN